MVEVGKVSRQKTKVSTAQRRFNPLSSRLCLPHRTTAFLAARYSAASTSGETAVPELEAEAEERISSSRRGIQTEAAASATIAPGALQIDAGKDRAAAGFCCNFYVCIKKEHI